MPLRRLVLGIVKTMGSRMTHPLFVCLLLSPGTCWTSTPSPSPTPVGGARARREGTWGLGATEGRRGGAGQFDVLPSPPLLLPAVVVLYTQSRASQEWREVSPRTLAWSRASTRSHLPPSRPRADSPLLIQFGRTEVIDNTLNPDFVCKFVLDYFFEEKQNLRFDV